jgi:hypothetical protein
MLENFPYQNTIFPLKIGTTLKISNPIFKSHTVKYIPKKERASAPYRCPIKRLKWI